MTDEELLDKIEDWHLNNAGPGLSLHEYLGWSWEEYKAWAESGGGRL